MVQVELLMLMVVMEIVGMKAQVLIVILYMVLH